MQRNRNVEPTMRRQKSISQKWHRNDIDAIINRKGHQNSNCGCIPHAQKGREKST